MTPIPVGDDGQARERWQAVPPVHTVENRRRWAKWAAGWLRLEGKHEQAAVWEAIADDVDSYNWDAWLLADGLDVK